MVWSVRFVLSWIAGRGWRCCPGGRCRPRTLTQCPIESGLHESEEGAAVGHISEVRAARRLMCHVAARTIIFASCARVTLLPQRKVPSV